MPARRLRVLFLIDHALGAGGAERSAIGLITHLPRDRFELWLCSTRVAEPSVVDQLDREGVHQLHLGRRSKWDVHRLAELAALMRREHIDVIHAHMFGSNLWATLIGRLCRVPVVLAHEHSWSYEGEPLRRWIDGNIIGRWATRFVAVSSLDAKRMVSIEGVPREKVVMIPNALVPRSNPRKGDLRRELGLAQSTPLIAVAAVLRPEKALSVLVQAFSLVRKSVPDARLVIAGNGPCQAELEDLATELGVQGGVHFLGRRDDIDAILRSADVAAMSSDREGSPLFALECLANGTPLVATCVGGLPDIVEDGCTGLLVPPRDPVALAAALVSLVTDPALRQRMAVAASKRRDQFTIDVVARRFADLYEQLAADAGAPMAAAA